MIPGHQIGLLQVVFKVVPKPFYHWCSKIGTRLYKPHFPVPTASIQGIPQSVLHFIKLFSLQTPLLGVNTAQLSQGNQ